MSAVFRAILGNGRALAGAEMGGRYKRGRCWIAGFSCLQV